MTIQEWVRALQHSRSLSQKQMAKLLGYKSQTSLARIMHNNASAESIEQLYQRLLQCKELSLSAKEAELLDQALSIAKLGETQYLTEMELLRLLKRYEAEEATVHIECIKESTTKDLSSLYSDIDNVTIIIMNCSNVHLGEWLGHMLKQYNADIRHYHGMTKTNDYLHGIVDVLPVLFNKKYLSFDVIADQMESNGASGLVNADLMICTYTTPNGSRHEDIIAFTDKSHGRLISVEPQNVSFVSLLNLSDNFFTPAKSTFPDYASLEDYTMFIMEYACLEIDRSVYRFKPDIPTDLIPTQILKRALLEGPWITASDSASFIDALEEQYTKRLSNAINKRKPAYLVMKREAMQRFAVTGTVSDHFWVLRPFTKEERISIIEFIIEQQKTNLFFHLYFLKDDDYISNGEYALYDNLGLLLLPVQTDYYLSGDYGEVLLNQPEICKAYMTFYMKTVIQKEVISSSESLHFLEHLVSVLKSE